MERLRVRRAGPADAQGRSGHPGVVIRVVRLRVRHVVRVERAALLRRQSLQVEGRQVDQAARLRPVLVDVDQLVGEGLGRDPGRRGQ